MSVSWLDAELKAAGVPIIGVSSDPLRIQHAPEATADQREAGQAILDAFDPLDAMPPGKVVITSEVCSTACDALSAAFRAVS